MKNIVLIGSGNLAEALARAISRTEGATLLQIFARNAKRDFAKIPLFVEGNDDTFTSELEAFARNLSRTVYRADSDRRVRLHLAAVFASNFVNHLYALGGEILHGTELPFDVLNPLIAETAAKAVDSGDPHRVQTGPAVRGDLPTLRRHEAALAHDPRLLRIYESLSQDIWETSKKTS